MDNHVLLFEDWQMDVMSQIQMLRDANPDFDLRMDPSERFKGAWSVALHRGGEYLAGVKGPCSEESALDFFSSQLSRLRSGAR